MMRSMLCTAVTTATLAMTLVPSAGWAQAAPAAAPVAAPALSYGLSVGIDDAKKVAAAAVAEAHRRNINMVIVVVDTGANLVYVEKMDGAQTGSIAAAVEKARTAVLFRRSTKVFEDAVAAGGQGLRLIGAPGVLPIEGGLPLVQGGKITGAVGLSGSSTDQDGACALAGAGALK